MRKFTAALVAAFLMPLIFSINAHAMTEEEYQYEIWKQFNEQFWEQYYAQRDALLNPKKDPEVKIEEEVEEVKEEPVQTSLGVTDEEFEALCMIGMNEAGNQGTQGIRYVIACVLNRVDDPKRPNDILGVIYEPNQFWTKGVNRPTEEVKEAVRLELQNRSDYTIEYFRTGDYTPYGKAKFVYKDHFFSEAL